MNKEQFLKQLDLKLSIIKKEERRKILQYYEESIDDRMEDGKTEEEAVMEMGDIDKIAKDIIGDQSFMSLFKSRISITKNKERSVLSIILIILGFPLWFPLFITAFSLAFTFLVVALTLIFSLYIILISFGVAAIFGLISGILSLFISDPAIGLFTLGISLVLFSITILIFIPCKKGTIALVNFFRRIIKKIKVRLFSKKEVI